MTTNVHTTDKQERKKTAQRPTSESSVFRQDFYTWLRLRERVLR